jgi:4-hydroxy-tetrahydrodipicolinate synthase
MNQSATIQGVLPVIAMPFSQSGQVDFDSVARIIDHCVESGVNGIVCFGLASELYKLSDRERSEILAFVMQKTAGRVPVIVGTEHSGKEPAVERSYQAFEAGASAVMVYPPTFVKPDESNIISYFKAIGSAINIPVIIQDALAWTGVPLPVSLLSQIKSEQPNVNYIKVEAPPIGAKARALQASGFSVISGYGAVHLLEDLSCGIVGFMPGCSLPSFMVQIWRSFQEGEIEDVKSIYRKILPLLNFQMTSLDAFIEVQKMLLQRQGVISESFSREPHVPLTEERVSFLKQIISDEELFKGVFGKGDAL